jgi:hypothetical protein
MIVDPERVFLTAIDTSTSYTHAALLPLGKVSSDQYSLRSFASFLKMLPYAKMILQVDQEPALLSLARRAAVLSGKEIEVRATSKVAKEA